MDPYVVIELGGQKFKTKVKDGAGKTPEWNEMFELDESILEGEITLKVMDEDPMSSDLVGEVTMSMDEIGEGEQTIEVFHKGKSAGTVLISCELVEGDENRLSEPKAEIV